MNLYSGRRDRLNQEMASSLPASLFLLSVVFCQFLSAAAQNYVTITATAGDDVILPCEDPDQEEIKAIEWSRIDLGSESVLLYRNLQFDLENQHPSYRNRVDLLVGQIKKGDASLVLKNTMTDDSGMYKCHIVKLDLMSIYFNWGLINYVSLVVAPPRPEPFPTWAILLLVLLVLALVNAVLYSWFCWSPVSKQVKVKSGEKFVLLNCRFKACLPAYVRVEWRDECNRKVHVYQKGSYCSDEKNQRYRNRTKMDKNFSLILTWPTEEDTGTYTCSVSNRDGVVLMKKEVNLQVKVHQVVKVVSGVESVLLPWRITENLGGDVKVEWRDGGNRTVHVYQNGSDQAGEQDEIYRTRTKMDENLLKNKNLSLTLNDPTFSDLFTCRVYSRAGTILMMKQVQLKVKDQQVEVEEGAESVELPFRVTSDLLEGDGVTLWWSDKEGRIVHMEQNDSVYQAQFYKGRTRMNEDFLETGDLSLTLTRPTKRDSSWFRIGVYKDGELLRIKSIELNIKGRVQVQPKYTRTRRNSVDPSPLMADQSV